MREELRDGFVLVAETKAVARIRSSLDVIGLQSVISVDIIGMFANDRADHMDRIDAVAPGRRLDLGD